MRERQRVVASMTANDLIDLSEALYQGDVRNYVKKMRRDQRGFSQYLNNLDNRLPAINRRAGVSQFQLKKSHHMPLTTKHSLLNRSVDFSGQISSYQSKLSSIDRIAGQKLTPRKQMEKASFHLIIEDLIAKSEERQNNLDSVKSSAQLMPNASLQSAAFNTIAGPW